MSVRFSHAGEMTTPKVSDPHSVVPAVTSPYVARLSVIVTAGSAVRNLAVTDGAGYVADVGERDVDLGGLTGVQVPVRVAGRRVLDRQVCVDDEGAAVEHEHVTLEGDGVPVRDRDLHRCPLSWARWGARRAR